MKKVFVILASAALMVLAVSCGNCCGNKAAEATTEETVECACEQKCENCCDSCSCAACDSTAKAE